MRWLPVMEHMKFCFTNSFTANTLILPQLYNSVQHNTVRYSAFPRRGRLPLNLGQKSIIWQFFAENCTKMKEMGPGASLASHLGPPMASTPFQPHNTSHKIFSYTIKIWPLFRDNAINTCSKVPNYFVKLCFIWFLVVTEPLPSNITVKGFYWKRNQLVVADIFKWPKLVEASVQWRI